MGLGRGRKATRPGYQIAKRLAVLGLEHGRGVDAAGDGHLRADRADVDDIPGLQPEVPGLVALEEQVVEVELA